MLYIGHFSFVESLADEEGQGTSIGAFQCLAEADDIDTALEKLKAIIVDLHERGDMFDEIEDIFLDSCVEVRHVPEDGMLTHFQEWTVQCSRVGSISTDVPGVGQDCAAVFRCGPEADLDDEEVEAEVEVEPFVTFQ